MLLVKNYEVVGLRSKIAEEVPWAEFAFKLGIKSSFRARVN